MGTVQSACEGCFGDKLNPQNSTLNPKNKDDAPKYQELKEGSHQNLDKSDLKANNGDSVKSQSNKTTFKKGTQQGSTRDTKDKSATSTIPDKGKKLTINDFDLIRVLGRGSFGKVYLCQKKSNKKYYALKTLKKEEILNRGHIENAMIEKNVLQNARHPFVVRLRYSFQNEANLYLVMDFCQGGELFMQLKRRGRFDEATARFYAAEVLLGLQYLHEKLDIIYRDLKPENVLLNTDGHIKITDFGLSTATKKSYSFCGTPEYLAPEILMGQGHDRCVDWWSLGCLVYEMLAGYPPFSANNRTQLYQDIVKAKPVMPPHFGEKSTDLLLKLLVRNPTKRLGANGIEEIKNHPFFEGVSWEDMLNLKVKPPIIPTLTRADDVRNFDRAMINEPVVETPLNNLKILDDPKNKLQGFTYIQRDGLESYADDPKSLFSKN